VLPALSLVGTAGLFVLLDAYLLAVLLVLVYAGAVVALFLFIVMLLDMRGGDRRSFKRTTVAASALCRRSCSASGCWSFVTHGQLGADLRAGRPPRSAPRSRGTAPALHHLPPARADRRFPSAHRHARRDRAQQAPRGLEDVK
jgi:hypothetical protein